MVPEPTLKDAANQLKNNNRDKVSDYINSTHIDLVETKLNSIIPEIIFKNHFLVFFYRLSTGVETLNSPLYLKWVELAGGNYNEVNVVDELGNVLYTVPPIHARPNVDDAELDNMNFSTIAGNFTAHSNRIKEQGINYLNRELSSVPNSINTDVNADINRWITIFKRYSAKPSVEELPKTIINEKIELNYD